MGGWALEFLARAHFHRAERYAHTGFAYDAELDRYECPQGELLTLHTFDDRNKLAIYKAPASSCNECVLKAFCTPHDEGRHVYRSLAEFHETDVGRFHRWLSLLILVVALAFSAGGLLAWWNKPGEWLLVIATGISLVLLWLDVRDVPEKSGKGGRIGSRAGRVVAPRSGPPGPVTAAVQRAEHRVDSSVGRVGHATRNPPRFNARAVGFSLRRPTLLPAEPVPCVGLAARVADNPWHPNATRSALLGDDRLPAGRVIGEGHFARQRRRTA